jgi:hypothetical protein
MIEPGFTFQQQMGRFKYGVCGDFLINRFMIFNRKSEGGFQNSPYMTYNKFVLI